MTPNAKALFESLLASRSTKLERQKITGLWNALEQMRQHGAELYSIAAVGVYSARHSGPKTQSIRNKEGKDFRDLIDAFSSDVGRPVKRNPRPAPPIEIAIEQIPDKGMQLTIRMMVADRNALKAENDQLRASFRTLSINPSEERNLDAGSSLSISPSPLAFFELEAVKRFLSEDWIEERSWQVEDDGSIVEALAGMLIAPPGFVLALREVLGLNR